MALIRCTLPAIVPRAFHPFTPLFAPRPRLFLPPLPANHLLPVKLLRLYLPSFVWNETHGVHERAKRGRALRRGGRKPPSRERAKRPDDRSLSVIFVSSSETRSSVWRVVSCDRSNDASSREAVVAITSVRGCIHKVTRRFPQPAASDYSRSPRGSAGKVADSRDYRGGGGLSSATNRRGNRSALLAGINLDEVSRGPRYRRGSLVIPMS